MCVVRVVSEVMIGRVILSEVVVVSETVMMGKILRVWVGVGSPPVCTGLLLIGGGSLFVIVS